MRTTILDIDINNHRSSSFRDGEVLAVYLDSSIVDPYRIVTMETSQVECFLVQKRVEGLIRAPLIMDKVHPS